MFLIIYICTLSVQLLLMTKGEISPIVHCLQLLMTKGEISSLVHCLQLLMTKGENCISKHGVTGS